MKTWWKSRSLSWRLAVSFAAVCSAILLALAPIAFGLIEHRLHLENDQQLRVDWNLVFAHLEDDPSGGVRWRKRSPATPESAGYAATWFEVWRDHELLLHHWPQEGLPSDSSPDQLTKIAPHRYRTETRGQRHFRVLEQVAIFGRQETTLRILRDESGLQRTLLSIALGFGFGAPLAALLAATGGYLMARHLLKPISAMAEQARRITAESLDQRLPNPHPHDEVGQLAGVINTMFDRLETSFTTLRRFTADASHELRTPLTALQTVGEVALRTPHDEVTLRDTIGSMLEETQRLTNLTNMLLFLARVEGQQFKPRLERIGLCDLLREIQDGVQVLAAEKEQTLDLEVTGPIRVQTDPVLLRQAIWNLVHNAHLYSPSGSRITLRAFTRDECAIIEITDEGPGIDLEHQLKVFERFYRVDQARSREDGGAGLGLAISKFSVERLGGCIQLKSLPGHGCQFTIQLPDSGKP